MRGWAGVAGIMLVLLVSVGSAEATVVRLEMNFGIEGDPYVHVELFDDRPLTVANFLQYVNGDLYEGTFLHRLVPGFVLQGGGFYTDYSEVDLDGDPETPNPTVPNEFDNEPPRSNVRGTVAMAKVGGDPDSATNQFFFNLADNSANLDHQNGGFTVFGHVIGGMDLIDALASVATYDLGGAPLDEVPLVEDGGYLYFEVIVATDVVSVLTGDVNIDGAVDISDFGGISESWDPFGAGHLYEEGDLDGDGAIGNSDFAMVLGNWSPAGPAPVTVPEPTALWLLMLGGWAWVGRRRR
jgi:cyclophilin family peptidyl-prolyl cis-trans isomerase